MCFVLKKQLRSRRPVFRFILTTAAALAASGLVQPRPACSAENAPTKTAAEDKRNHWAFKAPVRPAVPVVKQKGWVRNPIDAFVLAKLEKEKLKPSPAADRITLLRRLNLDLIG